MPQVMENFSSQNADPFNNLVAQQDDQSIQIAVHEYASSAFIKLSPDEAIRLANWLIKEATKC